MNKTLTVRRRHGFTIVEIIVVIAVIGTLAAVGIVSYGSYRTRAAKSAADSTAQQVKLKLGEYFTDYNKYPTDKGAIDTYLRSVNATSVADDFKTMTDNGATYAPLSSSDTSCTTGSPPPSCAKYTITVPVSYWKGGTSDTAITVKP